MTPANSYPAMSAWLERAWLARYLDGLLSEDEAAWFEEYVLDKPELLAMIDADTRLRQAMLGGARDGAASFALAQDLPGDREGNVAAVSDTADAPATTMRNTPRSNRASLGWLAMAAALVLGLGIGRMTVRSSADALIANPTHAVYDTIRGAEIPPRIEHADSQSPYVLMEISVPPGAEKVTLHMDTGEDTPLFPAPNGFVRFLLPRTRVESSKEARVDYTVNGQQQSRPISFRELHREK